MLVWSYRASYGFPAIITRGSNTYGHHQYPEKIIPLFITNAIDDLPLPIYGSGRAVRDYIHVEDHCRAIDLVLHAGEVGETYNIGTGVETSGLEVANAVLKATGKPESLIEFVQDRLGHDYRYAVDTAKIRALGWTPRIDFAEGLSDTVDWYLAHQDWWRPLKSGEYWEYYRRNYKPLQDATAGPGQRPGSRPSN